MTSNCMHICPFCHWSSLICLGVLSLSFKNKKRRIPAYRRSIKNELNVEKMLPEEATRDEMHKYTLCGICVPSAPRCFIYSLKQCPHLPHLPTETLCPLSVVWGFFTVPLVKTRVTKAHLLLRKES